MSSSVNTTQILANYSNSLSTRFYGDSLALQVLMGLIMIFIFIVELVKISKKTYDYIAEDEYQLEAMKECITQTQNVLKEKSQIERQQQLKVPKNNENQRKQPKQMEPELPPIKLVNSLKKQKEVPKIIKIQNVIKNKLPQLTILAINVVMIASYEYITITAYIAVVLIVINEVLGHRSSENLNFRFILDLLSKLLILSWYINVFTVGKPPINSN